MATRSTLTLMSLVNHWSSRGPAEKRAEQPEGANLNTRGQVYERLVNQISFSPERPLFPGDDTVWIVPG